MHDITNVVHLWGFFLTRYVLNLLDFILQKELFSYIKIKLVTWRHRTKLSALNHRSPSTQTFWRFYIPSPAPNPTTTVLHKHFWKSVVQHITGQAGVYTSSSVVLLSESWPSGEGNGLRILSRDINLAFETTGSA